ncbi:MAG: hypothetical protein ACI9VR_002153 [Cognaticolwellia sp.]|jgi:hypothetical protein
MNKHYAIPLAVLALAGATGCTDPVASDWELIDVISAGQSEGTATTYTYEGGEARSIATVSTLRIEGDLYATLEAETTRTDTYPGEQDRTRVFSSYFIGEVIPGNNEGKYRIDLDASLEFKCELQKENSELTCTFVEDEVEVDDEVEDSEVIPLQWVFEATGTSAV